ncbi:membrane protein [Gigaspora margarita]|uniref:Membrane protein n=1 Tax=Gigaspora margarita TaxID=4874 RepID=A0A8H3XIF0_GIGMA|nr:membrane protein [Gigaspora margarita]
MSYLKESNKIDNKNYVIRSSGDSSSPLALGQHAPSTTLEPPPLSTTLEPSPPSTTLEPPPPSTTLEQPSTNKNNSFQKNKLKILLFFLFMLFVDVGLPLIIYAILSKYIYVIWALVISGIPPIISVILNFIIRKQVNAIGMLSIAGFIAGTILAIYQDDAKLYLIRDSFVTGVIGLVFVISLIPIKVGSFEMRPLLYYNSKNLGLGDLKGLTEDEPIPERWERYWRSYAFFRRLFIVMTAVWGFGLILEVPARLLIIFYTKTVDEAVYIANIFVYSWLSILILFNIIYSRYMKKLGKKREAEAEAAAAAANNQA